MDEEQSVMAWSLTRKTWMKNRVYGLVSVKEDLDEEQSVMAWSLTRKAWMKNRV